MKISQASFLGKSKQVLKKTDFSKKRCVMRLLHLGGGVQSSTIAEMSIEGDLPHLDLAIFADTGDEPSWVYDQISYLSQRLSSVSTPLIILKKSELGLVGDAQKGHGRFASMPFYTKDSAGNIGRLKRQCTSEYKIEVINDYLRDWFIEQTLGKIAKNGSRRINRGIYIESLFGISYDEIERLKDRSTEWQKDIYPLVDKKTTREACEEYLKSKSLPVPKKSSCRVCAFHDDEYWLDLSVNHPSDFEHACDFDDWIRSDDAKLRLTMGLIAPVYLHRSCVPLRDINFVKLLSKERPVPMFCGAHCMT